MALNDSQKKTVASWVQAGDSLGSIQNKIHEEFGVSMTFMDVRFLVDDLDLTLVDKIQPKREEPKPDLVASPAGNATAAAPVPSPEAAINPVGNEAAAGSMQVSIDKIPHPSYALSGTVVFPDGEKAIWVIDPQGRFGMQPEKEGYKPSQEYIRQFQTALEAELQRNGM